MVSRDKHSSLLGHYLLVCTNFFVICALKGKRITLNIRLGLNRLPGTNTLAYLTIVLMMKKNKMFDIFGTKGPNYKTFYCRNLRIFVIS
jgi:hypothetical protein